jgi:dCMP deaminase
MRKSFDEIFLDFAQSLSERSVDQKFKVGCIITNSDNTRVLSFGYNGDEHGGTNQRESLETGNSGFIHAEENAIIKLDYSEPYKKVYLTHSPCKMCCKKLINAKVNEIIFKEVYDQLALDWITTHPVGKHIKIKQLK